MLQLTGDSIHEVIDYTTQTNSGDLVGHASVVVNGCNIPLGNWPSNTVYWNSYPVYVCTDKTAKAIEILKKLQGEKVIDVKSVNRFIELVEQISAIL